MRSYKIDNTLRHLRKKWYSVSKNKSSSSYDVGFDQTYELYKRAAITLGLSYDEFGRCREISDGRKFFRFWMDCTEFCTVPLVGSTEDKEFVTRHLAANGIPAPRGQSYYWRDEKAALDFGMKLGGPFVIKPASDTEGGEGVFTGLRSIESGRAAFRRAAAISNRVLVEEHVTGENFRMLNYKGKCLSVIHRRKPGVTGDGEGSIAQLVERENKHRICKNNWRLGDPPFAPLILDGEVLRRLKSQSLSADSVPAAGETVTFSDVCNYSRGGTIREVFDKFNQGIIEDSIEAAKLFDAPLTGIDVILADANSNKYYVNEINVAPSLSLHYTISNIDECRYPIEVLLRDFFG